MADYSMSPLELLVANRQKGYVGLHIEQGVPLLDRDLNLLHDLISETVRSVITRYIGNGIAADADGFAITALPAGQNSQNFRIAKAPGATPGRCLVGGIEVFIAADKNYLDQADVANLTPPTAAQEDPRNDIVYLDVSLVEVDGATDLELANNLDVGMQTSVRLLPSWVVRVAEGGVLPDAEPGHYFCPLAQLRRPRGNALIDATMITDLRQSRLTVSDMERRLSLMERLLLQPAFASGSTQFLPKSGPINQVVTLIGTNFNIGEPQVKFGNIVATTVGNPSATQIVVKVPKGLTPDGVPAGVKITVTNPGGFVVSEDTFTALPMPAFADTGPQFTPNHGLPNDQIVINGFNFNAANPQVTFGQVAATIVGTPGANQIVAQVPAGLVPGGSTFTDLKITVTTDRGTATSDGTFRAEINTPAPTFVAPPVAQFLPKSGPGGQTITLNGQNFNFVPVSVLFDTTAATVSGTPSATQIAVVVPSGMTTVGVPKGVKITVKTPGGSVVSTDTFTITGP